MIGGFGDDPALDAPDLGYPLVDHPATTEDCEPHTPSPKGYLAHAEWMEEMSRTHTQRRCKGCRRFLIWEPKEPSGERLQAA